MGRFIITEEERNHIKGLYEQDQLPREPLDPESINGDFKLTLFVDPSLVNLPNEEVTQPMTDEFRELAPSSGIHVRTIMKSRINPKYINITFELDVKNKDTMKQSPWLSNFGKNVKNKISEIYKVNGVNVNVSEPKFTWGKYFESEPTNSPDKCIGLSYRVTTSQPTPQ